MATIMIKAKLYIPPVRPERVHRPRLFRMLDAGLQRKITLLSAPTGFGKTSLLTAWLKDRNIPTAWFSIDKEDNSPSRFWSYILKALQTIHPGIGDDLLTSLASSGLSPSDHQLSGLLNELWGIRSRSSLVLDDYHWIENQDIQDGLLFLVDHMPPAMHLILSTRADPPWPLARLRGRLEINELRIEDLRFTIEETSAFLNSIAGLGLAEDDIITLDERTEGWIVGLQMAALSMQGRMDKSEFINKFSGSHRFILDYLVEEVLSRLPAELREFLIKTSLLNRMSGSLCDAVLGRSNSQEVLEKIEKANLFCLPLDDERRWYRYHHLFADLLRDILLREFPDLVQDLHRHASQWYAKTGLLSESANHAFMSGDVAYVANLIEENALIVITVLNDHLPAMVALLNALPVTLLHSQPWLAVARAWVLAYSGELESAEAVILEAENSVQEGLADSQRGHLNPDQLAGYLAAIRGYWFFMQGDIACGVAWMQKAVLLIPDTDPPTKIFSAVVLGSAIGMNGDLEGSIQLLSDTADRWRDTINPIFAILISGELAGLLLLAGRIKQVIAVCQTAIQASNEYYHLMGLYPPNMGFIYARLSYALREQYDLEAAIYYAREAVKSSREWGQKDCICTSYIYLALAFWSQGNKHEAMMMINKARQVSRGLSSALDAHTAAYEAIIHENVGNLTLLARWSTECGLNSADEIPFHRVLQYIVYARALLVQGKLAESLVLVERLLTVVRAAGARLYETELLILKAILLYKQGAVEQAIIPFAHAIRLAEAEGYVSIFIDEGARVRELIRLTSQHDYARNYALRLLAALDEILQPREDKGSLAEVQPHSGYYRDLTRREIEVLKLLCTHRSVNEIAAELCIATSTLRTHIRNIYAKLGIHSRREAVMIVREMPHP